MQGALFNDTGVFPGERVIVDPAASFLTEIPFAFYKAAKVALMNIFPNVLLRPDAVQPWVLRVSVIGNLILLI